MRKMLLLCYLLLSGMTNVWASALKGTILDSKTNEPLPFVNIEVMNSLNVKIGSSTTDLDGKFTVKPIDSGIYSVKIILLGYQPELIKNVKVGKNKISFLDVKLTSQTSGLSEIVVKEFKNPLIPKENVTGAVIEREQIQMAPSRDVNGLLSTSSGVIQSNEGNEINVRGGRSEKTTYYVDGIKVIGGGNQIRQAEVHDEGYKNYEEGGYFTPISNPLSTFSIDVDKASYSNVRRFLTQGNSPPKDAVRVEELINYFNYDYPDPIDEKPFNTIGELTFCPWEPTHKLLKIGIKAKDLKLEHAPASNLVFLIDVSGSMDSPDKLPLVKQSLRLLVNNLREEDDISLVVYAGSAGMVLPSTSGNFKQRILTAIENLSAGGSTAGGEGINLAYQIAKDNFKKNGNNRIILATDGDFNVGVSRDEDLVKLIEKKRNEGIFLTVLGFGTGNYKDSKMEQLADKGNGNYSYIDNLFEAQKVLVNEMNGTLFTIAKDVKIQIEFNPKAVKEYRLIGYDNRKLADKDFNDDKKDAGEVGAGHTVTALYEIVPAGNSVKIQGDSLRYQSMTPTKSGESEELALIKIRYKDPKEEISKLISQVVLNKSVSFDEATENTRFSACVAMFGMLLKDSDYKGNSNFEMIYEIAKKSKGSDEEGYRQDFIKLVGLAKELNKVASR